MAKTRILVVDASVVVRRLLTHVLASDPSLEVVGSAPNGHIALAKVPQVNPDLIILDIEMPDGDGPRTLAALRKSYPRLPVIIFAALTDQTPAAVIEMLTLGASDYVTKAVNATHAEETARLIRDELIPKIKVYTQVPAKAGPLPALGKTTTTSEARGQWTLRRRVDVLVIGVSTGGPNALAELLQNFPSDFPVPVLIVQHMPPMFTKLLADRLDRTCHIRVSQGTPNEAVRPGRAWMAPGNFHMTLQKHNDTVRIQIDQSPPENSCRPSVDVLFRSAAEVYGPHVLAVVLTGMGQDGLRGCERVHEEGGQIFAQDEASSIVWGMPGFVVKAGLAHKVLPLQHLGDEIMRSVWEYRSPRPDRLSVRSQVEKD